ncbi:MAG: hypothetical protein KBD83_04480 [Gammaproteobacteria bacterium]|nr:hypothetical protein [Gammaproteobacteria bacterium]
MQKTRTDIINLLASIKHTKERYVYVEKDIISLSNQAEYHRTVEHYDHLILALTKELQALPIGYRYTGTYYLKKPYTQPAEFEEGSGSLYMKENLVSWQTETGSGVYDSPYYRAVFKKPYGDQITKEDAEPVYAK